MTDVMTLSMDEIEQVDGGVLPLLAIAFVKGFIMGAGTVAAGGAILDAAGVVDLW